MDTLLGPEHRALLDACRRSPHRPLWVAGVAVTTGHPVGVVRVLLGDLRRRGHLRVTTPASSVLVPHDEARGHPQRGDRWHPRSLNSPGIRTPPSRLLPRATAWKILVAGGPGTGKTTLIGAVTGRALRLRTEAPPGSGPLDSARGGAESVGEGGPATVTTDFGRLTVRRGLPLYLFDAPAHDPFWFLWDELALGVLGAVILADTGELDGCFSAVDHFERLGLPFLVAINCFPRAARAHSSREVAAALDLECGTPVVLLDARDREAGKENWFG